MIPQSAGCAHIARFIQSQDGVRLPSSKRAVSIPILWCTLNACMSMVGLHWTTFGKMEGNMAKKAKKAKKTAKKTAKKKKK